MPFSKKHSIPDSIATDRMESEIPKKKLRAEVVTDEEEEILRLKARVKELEEGNRRRKDKG